MLVWAIRQPDDVQADDMALLAVLREKYAKVQSQEAYGYELAHSGTKTQ